MIYDNTKNIPIKNYLKNIGIHPYKEYISYGMYISPFRQEEKPSLKVDYNKNLWYDFGINQGGSIIDLVMKIHNYSLKETYDHLSNYTFQNINTTPHQYNSNNADRSFSFHRDSSSTSGITLLGVKPLSHPKLLEYLQERKINTDIATKVCDEIHYQIKGRNYFAIGFKNDNSGYEIRNPYFKGCISPKSITYIKLHKEEDTCYLFEGFMDYLSFLSLQSKDDSFKYCEPQNSIILNSISNLSKSIPILESHHKIQSFLDNDNAGQKVFDELKSKFGSRIVDASDSYSGHKDLNDYLCNKKHLSIPQPYNQKKRRGLRF